MMTSRRSMFVTLLPGTVGDDVTSTAKVDDEYPLMAGCVIAVIVMGCACAVVASIYWFIYYTRIRGCRDGGGGSGRPRHHDQSSGHHESAGGGDRPASTHIFMFKKS